MNPEPESEAQESQEPYEAADSGALETADPKVGYVPEFMGLSKEDVPDDAETESSPGTEEQAEETDEQRTEGAEESAEEESPDADDPTGRRYADQQSRADKAENRVKELESKAEEQESLAKETEQLQPIIQLIQQDPALRQALSQRLSGQAISIEDPLTVPDKPVEPTRPAMYNKDDATNEPDSESAKFDLAIQNYPGEVERWREAKEQIDTKKANERALVARQEQFMTDFSTSLKDLGVAEDEIPSVIAYSQSEKNNTVSNLAKALLGMYRGAHKKDAPEQSGEKPKDQATQAAATAASRKPKKEIVDETEADEEVPVREYQTTWESRLLESSRA